MIVALFKNENWDPSNAYQETFVAQWMESLHKSGVRFVVGHTLALTNC